MPRHRIGGAAKHLNVMGQRSSRQVGGRFGDKLPFFFFFRDNRTTHNPNPEQPIKFQYKTKRKTTENHRKNEKSNEKNCVQTVNNVKKSDQNVDVKCEIVRTQNAPVRTKSEPNLLAERREKHRRRRKSAKIKNTKSPSVARQFGYDIQNVDEFLAKATLDAPANIPVVLAFPSVLYRPGCEREHTQMALPLGMVVNAVFRNRKWLYVQTPHQEEGYVNYAACLPLGIIPPPEDDRPAPCWEKSTDVFPKPSGNMTDTEKLSSKSEFGDEISYCRARSRTAVSTCGEKSVDRLYLRAAAQAKGKGTRQTLLVIISNFEANDKSFITVKKGEVVFLLDAQVKGWFYVKNKDGVEGFIPSVVAGHGFL